MTPPRCVHGAYEGSTARPLVCFRSVHVWHVFRVFGTHARGARGLRVVQSKLFANQVRTAVASPPCVCRGQLARPNPRVRAHRPLFWGRSQGCPWATEKCITSSGPKHGFCDESGAGNGCTPDRKASGYCQISTYTSTLPASYQYFTNGQKGGSLAQAHCTQQSLTCTCMKLMLDHTAHCR